MKPDTNFVEKESNSNSIIAEKKALSNTTGGYDGKYSSGFSQKNIAQQIRNVNADMGQQMCEIAKADGMNLTQTEGYFNFGAGQKIICDNFSVIVPTAFTFSKNILNQIFIAYSTDATVEDLKSSPIELWVSKTVQEKKLLICDFYSLYITDAFKRHLPYNELVISGNSAIMMIEKTTNTPLKAQIYVLCHNGKSVYNIKIVINSKLNNIQSIIERIYSSIIIQENKI